MIAATISAEFANLKSEALAKWRGWCQEIAAGGGPPPALEILEAGALLEIETPASALEEDAAALTKAQQLEQRAAEVKAKLSEPIDELGGMDSVRSQLETLRAEVKRLEKLTNPWYWSAWSAILGHVAEIRRNHPRVFDAAPSQPTPKPAAKRRASA